MSIHDVPLYENVIFNKSNYQYEDIPLTYYQFKLLVEEYGIRGNARYGLDRIDLVDTEGDPIGALTSNTSNPNFLVSASSVIFGDEPFKAFDKNNTGTFWTSGINYNNTTGVYTGSTQTNWYSVGNVAGEWIQWNIPSGKVYRSIRIYPRTNGLGIENYVSPFSIRLFGGMDGVGFNEELLNQTNITGWTSAGKLFVFGGNMTAWKYYRLVITQVGDPAFSGAYNKNIAVIGEMYLYESRQYSLKFLRKDETAYGDISSTGSGGVLYGDEIQINSNLSSSLGNQVKGITQGATPSMTFFNQIEMSGEWFFVNPPLQINGGQYQDLQQVNPLLSYIVKDGMRFNNFNQGRGGYSGTILTRFNSSYGGNTLEFHGVQDSNPHIHFDRVKEQYLQSPSTLNLGANLTIMVRFKFYGTTASWERVFCFGNALNSNINQIVLGRNANTNKLVLSMVNASGTQYASNAGFTIVQDEWINVCITASPFDVKLYINDFTDFNQYYSVNTNLYVPTNLPFAYVGRSRYSGDSYANVDIKTLVVIEDDLPEEERLQMLNEILKTDQPSITTFVPTPKFGISFTDTIKTNPFRATSAGTVVLFYSPDYKRPELKNRDILIISHKHLLLEQTTKLNVNATNGSIVGIGVINLTIPAGSLPFVFRIPFTLPAGLSSYTKCVFMFRRVAGSRIYSTIPSVHLSGGTLYVDLAALGSGSATTEQMLAIQVIP
jgi:hypothetical protein